MVLKVKEVEIQRLTESEAMALRQEMLQATDGNLELYPDKFPAMNKLFKLITGAFVNSHEGVHFIKNRTS